MVSINIVAYFCFLKVIDEDVKRKNLQPVVSRRSSINFATVVRFQRVREPVIPNLLIICGKSAEKTNHVRDESTRPKNSKRQLHDHYHVEKGNTYEDD